MEIALIIVLILLVLVLLFFAVIYKKSLKYVCSEMKKFNAENDDANRQIKLNFPCKEAELLSQEINLMMNKAEQNKINSINKERELHQQIANISHDLRTPLTSILGYIEILKDKNISQADNKKYLKIVETRTKVLQDLITNFYELSSIKESKLSLNFETVNVNLILKELLAAFYQDFEDKKFVCQIDISEDPVNIIADKKLVARIFTNLLQNILKHGVSKFVLTEKLVDEHVIINFSNDVKSLSKEDLPYVFDRFYINDKMRSRQNTGLGLSIVKEFVEELGGEVSADLEEGLFTISVKMKCNL